jgi:hypothetical protein
LRFDGRGDLPFSICFKDKLTENKGRRHRLFICSHDETLSIVAMRWTRLCDIKKRLVDQAALA